jgi:hypothetical protein
MRLSRIVDTVKTSNSVTWSSSVLIGQSRSFLLSRKVKIEPQVFRELVNVIQNSKRAKSEAIVVVWCLSVIPDTIRRFWESFST